MVDLSLGRHRRHCCRRCHCRRLRRHRRQRIHDIWRPIQNSEFSANHGISFSFLIQIGAYNVT